MNGSGNLMEDIESSAHLCPVCLHKLNFALTGGQKITNTYNNQNNNAINEINFEKRYYNLANLYDEFGWTNDSQWIRKRISKVKNS